MIFRVLLFAPFPIVIRYVILPQSYTIISIHPSFFRRKMPSFPTSQAAMRKLSANKCGQQKPSAPGSEI